MKSLIAIFVSASLAVSPAVYEDGNVLWEDTEVPSVVEEKEEIFYHVYGDDTCRTPEIHKDEVARIIRETQTMELNFVELARNESGLYNHSYGSNLYRGLFQLHEGYHKLEDYCDPVQQVEWLEWKLNAGADPKRLFPNTYHYLYLPLDHPPTK